MSNTVKRNFGQKTAKSGWDKAIADAKLRIRALEGTIRLYKERKKDGDPWPGVSATRN